ncbi:MAG: insulinase family protein [Oscillospiraceae bacterium]
MINYEVANAARITVLPAEKFKRCRVSINFVWPAQRKKATAAALLAFLMERGYADCPDMTELSKRLAKLYGASLTVDTGISGSSRILSVTVSGIKDEFAIDGENLTQEYASIAFGVAFKPYLVNGVFDEEQLSIEREKLRELLEGEINEKRTYCIRQARRKFFGNSPEGTERLGYLDELDSVTVQDITEVFGEMLSLSHIEVMVMGADANTVKVQLADAISHVKRAPAVLNLASAQPRQKDAEYTQNIDAVQGKLCLLFTAGEAVPLSMLSAMRVAIALFGGTPTSRLFMNVREKQSLCYYCSAGYSHLTGMLCVDSGIEHKNAACAKTAILHELDMLINGEITQKELADTKRCLVNSLMALGDNIASLENWYFQELICGTKDTPQEVITQINSVSIDDVKKALSSFTLSVSYLLTKEGADNE